jgi:secreted trypsin-like serine protease
MKRYNKMWQCFHAVGYRKLLTWVSTFTLLTAIVNPLTAYAIIGGQIDPNTATSSWAGVGSLNVNGGTYTATAIGSRFILTAAHVVYGASAQNVSFNLNVGGNLTQSITVSAIHVFPEYQGFTPSADGLVHNDLAIIELSSDLPAGVPIYSLDTTVPTNTTTISMVGYGVGGNGLSGATISGSPSVKRVGTNQVDRLFAGAKGSADMYMFDFDGPTSSTNVLGGGALANEAQFGPGDSGSPSFVQVNGAWQILGVNTFVAATAAGGNPYIFGSLGGGTLVSAYSGWIQGIVAAPVPEPTTIGMLLAGGLFLPWITRRRRVNAV